MNDFQFITDILRVGDQNDLIFFLYSHKRTDGQRQNLGLIHDRYIC